MMAEWWLDTNPDFKLLDGSGLWLVGFCQQLKENKLHLNDAEHLQELITWHEEKSNSKGEGGGIADGEQRHEDEGEGGRKGEGESNNREGGREGEDVAGPASQLM
jgi:hypothetical protein